MEQSTAIFLGTFALLAFILKCLILFNIQLRTAVARGFAVLCLLFIVQNAAEFLGYFTYMSGQVAVGEFFVHIYMISLYFIFPAALQLALVLGESRRAGTVALLNFAMAAALTLAHTGGYVIAGFQFLGWTVITTPAQLYAFSMLFILLNLVATVGYLLLQVMFNQRFELRDRARVYLVAFSPLLLVAVAVIMLRYAGFNASSAVSLPIATTAFLFILLLHTNGNLFWLSLRLRTIIEIIRIRDLSSIDQIIERLDEVRIRQALKASNGNQRTSARLINLTEPTLSRRIARYKIDVSEYQRRPRPTSPAG